MTIFLSVLSKERQEMKELFRHENNDLREQDVKLQREDDQLRKRVEELQEQIVKLRDEKLQNDNAKLKKEIKKLRKDNEKLRHVDRRQRDQIDGFEFEAKVKDLIRQEDDVLERKKRQSQSSNSSIAEEAMSEVEIAGGSADDKKNNDIFPQMVWYDFGHGKSFVPARVTFRGRPNCDSLSCGQQTPAIWEFVGSNDDACAGSALSNVRMWKNVIQMGGVKNATRFE